MSTRSNIAIKLREIDARNGVENLGESFKAPYLQVYCHFDGYPNGVGRDLIEKKFTYEQALEFILKGSRSTCDDGCSYYEWRDEAYEDVKPKEMSAPQMQFACEYMYLLVEDENTHHMNVYLYTGRSGPKLVFKKIIINDSNEVVTDNDTMMVYDTNGIFKNEA